MRPFALVFAVLTIALSGRLADDEATPPDGRRLQGRHRVACGDTRTGKPAVYAGE